MQTDANYTPEDIAGIVDRDPRSVRRWIRNGDLTASRIGNRYTISTDQLVAWWTGSGNEVSQLARLIDQWQANSK